MKSLCFFAMGAGVALLLSFTSLEGTHENSNSNEVYEYAILNVHGFNDRNRTIYFSNGDIEKMPTINAAEWNVNENKYLIEVFNNLNMKGFELKSSSAHNLRIFAGEVSKEIIKEYVFSRKKQ